MWLEDGVQRVSSNGRDFNGAGRGVSGSCDPAGEPVGEPRPQVQPTQKSAEGGTRDEVAKICLVLAVCEAFEAGL